MPVREDKISQAKLEEYDNYLLLAGWECLTNRIQRQIMPELGEVQDKGIMEYMESEEMKWMTEKILREGDHD